MPFIVWFYISRLPKLSKIRRPSKGSTFMVVVAGKEFILQKLPVFKYWECYNATWSNMKCSSTLFLVLNIFWQKKHFCHLPYLYFLVTIQISLLCIVLVDVLISSSLFTLFYMNYTIIILCFNSAHHALLESYFEIQGDCLLKCQFWLKI